MKDIFPEVLSKSNIVRINGKLKEIVTVTDEAGNILSKMVSPLMVEFHLRDLFQVLVGAVLLAFPLSISEELWTISEEISTLNTLIFMAMSLVCISLFVYSIFYSGREGKHFISFFKRVTITYIISLFMVAFLLTLINRAPWSVDLVVALKRTIIIAFPASFSATIADSIK